MTKEDLRDIYKKYDLSPEDIFSSKQGFTIINRWGIEKIQAKEQIVIKYDVICSEKDFAVIKASTEKPIHMETFGSATYGNYEKKMKPNGRESTILNGTTNQWYITEIAEKRALARLVLKVTGLYSMGVYSEDEDFIEPLEKEPELNKVAQKAMNDLHERTKKKR